MVILLYLASISTKQTPTFQKPGGLSIFPRLSSSCPRKPLQKVVFSIGAFPLNEEVQEKSSLHEDDSSRILQMSSFSGNIFRSSKFVLLICALYLYFNFVFDYYFVATKNPSISLFI
jgi:hypothetical protein